MRCQDLPCVRGGVRAIHVGCTSVYSTARCPSRRFESRSAWAELIEGVTVSAYRREGENTLIEIRLREIRQLFHTLDPAPFREKDLDNDAERYLLEACREAGAHRPVRLVVYLPAPEATSDAAGTLPESIHNYFAYRERELRADIVRLMGYGVASFAIGLFFLMACLALRRALVEIPLMFDRAIIDEGLLILGWVAMWRPTEVLLYDWWPLARRRALLRRLGVIPVEIRTAA